jgi:hypothetical protein
MVSSNHETRNDPSPDAATLDALRIGEDCRAAALDWLHHGYAPTACCPADHRLGTRYRYLDGHSPGEIAIAPMPSWLVDLMNVDPRRQQGPRSEDGPANHDDVAAALFYLSKLKPERADDYNTWVAVGIHSANCTFQTPLRIALFTLVTFDARGFPPVAPLCAVHLSKEWRFRDPHGHS